MIENWNIAQHRKGNTFNKRKITFPFNIRNCNIVMKFKTSSFGNTIVEWNTTNGSLFKQTDNIIIMQNRILDIPLGTYDADFNITFEDGNIQTYFTATLQII